MFGMGVREWVALGVLGVAGLFGFLFFDPTSTDGGNTPPGTISLGETPLPATATPEPSATPVPLTQLPQPTGGWLIEYYESRASGGELLIGSGFAAELDVEAAGRPFPDVPDDAWRVVASQEFVLEPGRYRFQLEIDGAAKVSVGGKYLLDEADHPEMRRSEVVFDHAGGVVVLRFELRDTGGPVLLRWVP